MSTPPTTVAALETGDVRGFAVGEVEIDGESLLVAVADRPRLRRRGLMGVSDLGDLDGMLFVMEGMVSSAFTMRDTLIPLHIAFFAQSGELVDLLEMTPCRVEPCPVYQPAAEYRYAVEVPLGAFSDLGNSVRISVKG